MRAYADLRREKIRETPFAPPDNPAARRPETAKEKRRPLGVGVAQYRGNERQFVTSNVVLRSRMLV
jgi:hypothetical protein